MKKLLGLCLLLVFAAPPKLALGESMNPKEKSGAPIPLLVLIEYNPWLTVIGSDSPRFALYQDGTVIFLRQKEKSAELFSVKISPSEVDRWIGPKTLRAFEGQKSRYTAYGATDLTTSRFLLRTNEGSYKEVSIYGLDVVMEKEEKPFETIPGPILDLYQSMISYDNPAARPWLPPEIEAMLWPFEHARGANQQWPKGWPGPNHPKAKKRRGDSYSVFLPNSSLNQLREMISKLGESRAIEIDGKKWAVSYRLPFPGEEVWMRKAP